MEYTTIKFESKGTESWEILMAAKNPETLDVVKHSFAIMEKGEGHL